MFDVAVCGSINMDLLAYGERLPQPGETVTGAELVYAAGGKGGNQAVAAARLGARVAMVGTRGGDAFGEQVAASLRDAGVDTSAVAVADAPTGVALIAVDRAGENQIVVAPGANWVPAPAPTGMQAAVWVTQGETPEAVAVSALERARARGAVAIVNAAPAGRLDPELVARFDIAVVNRGELDQLGAARPPAMIVTMGGEGARILPSGDAFPAYPADPVDTTGAGDTLVGGLAAGLAEGMALPDALRLGMAAAAVSVERRGCQPAMPARAEALARQAQTGR